MRSTVLTGLLFLLIGTTASAQLTVLPQVGFEQSKTFINYGNLPSFSPLGAEGNLKAALRVDYRFKKGFGPYAAISSSPAPVAFSFTNPADAVSNYKATTNSLLWRLEGGYQYSSKPITLKKASAAKSVAAKAPMQRTEFKRSCGGYSHHGCGQQKSQQTFKKVKNNDLNLRLQPSVGVAYIPLAKEDFVSNGTTTQYNAGNWKTAVVSGMGFELGKGKQRLLTLGVFYTKGLTNMDTKTFSKIENGKPSTGSFSSSTSSWGMTVGVPFSLMKTQKHSVHSEKSAPAKTNQGGCRSRCVKHI